MREGLTGAGRFLFSRYNQAEGVWPIGRHEVLLALEEKIAGEVFLKLREISPFDDGIWEFRVCDGTRKLLREPVPEVLVLSRLLPGCEDVLEKVRRRFGQARTVFLTGRVNERARAFMHKARSLGFEPNFVTGDLPGDRPYPLPLAIVHDYREIVGQKEELREKDGSGPAGRVAVLGSVPLEGFTAVRIDKARRISRDIDVVLVEPGYTNAAGRIRLWRRTGYSGPILVYGAYDLDLIAAGATGSVMDAAGVGDYLKLSREGGSVS